MEKSPSPIATKEMLLKRKTSVEVPIVNIKSDETKAEASEVLNEEPNEKIHKSSELMTNMDPLEYFKRFLNIPEMIFRHFKGKDLITISEVSPSYYNFIASSKLFMEKIEVSFKKNRMPEKTPEDLHRRSEDSPVYIITSLKDLMEIKVSFHDECDPEDYNLLKNSSRLYQNIEIERSRLWIKHLVGSYQIIGDYLINSELDFLHSRAREWKSVSLDNVYFRKKLDIWKFLSAIESSVESFSVKDFGDLPFEDPLSKIEYFEAFKFPKLTKLKMTFKERCSGDIWARFFLNSVAVEELDLGDRSKGEGKDILTKMLQNFDKLTTLHIDSWHINLIFVDESWKQFQFKLKSFTVINVRKHDLGINFLNFFKSQSNYLENWEIRSEVLDREIFDVIMKMPKLKSFTLKYSRAYHENGVPINISNSITELTLLNWPSAATLKFLFDSMPKVTNLRLHLIDDENFKLLKSMKRKFETLKILVLFDVDRKEVEEIMSENYTSLEIVEICHLKC